MGKTKHFGPQRGVDAASLKHGGYDRSSTKLNKKSSGEKGKFSWGRPGDELLDMQMDQNDPNYDEQ